MEFFIEIAAWLGDLLANIIEWASGAKLGETTRTVVDWFGGIVAAIATLTGAFFCLRGLISWWRGDEDVTKADIANLKADLLAELRKSQNASDAADTSSSPGPSLETDLEAAVDTLLEAGKAEALKDISGRAAEDALDALIAERSAARNRIAKDEASLWRQKGAFAFLHDTVSAIAAYKRATDLDPDDAAGWNELGHLYRRVGDLDAAIAAYEKVLALGNQTADQVTIAVAYGNLGIVYKTRGDLDQAENMYRKSLEIEEALGRKEGMANQYANLGVVF